MPASRKKSILWAVYFVVVCALGLSACASSSQPPAPTALPGNCVTLQPGQVVNVGDLKVELQSVNIDNGRNNKFDATLTVTAKHEGKINVSFTVKYSDAVNSDTKSVTWPETAVAPGLNTFNFQTGTYFDFDYYKVTEVTVCVPIVETPTPSPEPQASVGGTVIKRGDLPIQSPSPRAMDTGTVTEH